MMFHVIDLSISLFVPFVTIISDNQGDAGMILVWNLIFSLGLIFKLTVKEYF